MIVKSNKMSQKNGWFKLFKLGLITIRPFRKTYFTNLVKIGEGVSSKVYSANYVEKKSVVILKKRDVKYRKEYEDEELTILSELNHKNVIKCHEILFGEKYDYIVTEKMDCDLRYVISNKYIKRQGFNVGQIKTIIYQLLNGLSYCKLKYIIHRDLKPANILVDKNTKIVKITDFGLSINEEKNRSRTSYTNKVVTLWYRAPEIILGMKKYSYAVDMWSLGCIFAELITLKPIFPGKNEINQLLRIFKIMGTPDYSTWTNIEYLSKYNPKFPKYVVGNLSNNIPRSFSKNGKDLLNKMLVLDPSKRISVIDAMNHPFFFSVIKNS